MFVDAANEIYQCSVQGLGVKIRCWKRIDCGLMSRPPRLDGNHLDNKEGEGEEV